MTENKSDQTPTNEKAQEMAGTLALIVAKSVNNGSYGGMRVTERRTAKGKIESVELHVVLSSDDPEQMERQVKEELKYFKGDQIPVEIMVGPEVDEYMKAKAPNNMSVAQAVSVLRGVAQERGAVPVVFRDITIIRPRPPEDFPGDDGTPILNEVWVQIIPAPSDQRRKVRRGNEAERVLSNAKVPLTVLFDFEKGRPMRVDMPQAYRALLKQVERKRR